MFGCQRTAKDGGQFDKLASYSFTVDMGASAASAATQSMTVVFDAGDAISEELDSCTISRKYVINSPRSCNCSKIQHIGLITYIFASTLIVDCRWSLEVHNNERIATVL